MSQDWARLGSAVRARRDELHMTQVDLAKKAGVSEGTVQNIESGRAYSRRPPSLPRIESSLGWAPGSVSSILSGGSPTPSEQPAAEAPKKPSASYAEGMPLRVMQELSDGQVLDTEVLDLTVPGSDTRMIVVLKRDKAKDVDPDQLRAELEEWSRLQRKLRGLASGPDKSDAS
ncbi:hypothetical protein GCM10010406_21760 [Streptomyces thermolineatus]|uniref:HTH cro/C1-type domain-containing protein n=1 Tax=Streptomyces thermolineatus TaxID=44033 RepID=A0ABN3LJ91_9ACTN